MLMTHNLSFRCHADMTTKGWESAKVEILLTAFVKVETDVITNISTSLRASCDISDLQNWCYCFYQYVFDVTLTDYFQYYSQFVDTCWLIIFSITVSLLILAISLCEITGKMSKLPINHKKYTFSFCYLRITIFLHSRLNFKNFKVLSLASIICTLTYTFTCVNWFMI
jgi:hypothetical protein